MANPATRTFATPRVGNAPSYWVARALHSRHFTLLVSMGNRLSRPNLFVLPYYHRVAFILCTRSTSEAKSSQLAGKPNAAAFRTEHDAKRALPAKNREPAGSRFVKSWSGQRDSNPRPSPWQGDALPAEPCPHISSRLEATPRFELGVKALQASALPLGQAADIKRAD